MQINKTHIQSTSRRFLFEGQEIVVFFSVSRVPCNLWCKKFILLQDELAQLWKIVAAFYFFLERITGTAP